MRFGVGDVVNKSHDFEGNCAQRYVWPRIACLMSFTGKGNCTN